jgi:pSer/pThr/pTyr-binding forkhead associated (FHA) protein
MQIYIKDLRSVNGTYINGDRLSPQSVESEPRELKSNDIVEFGIDIIGENKINRYKVSTRAVVVLTPEDLKREVSDRELRLNKLTHSIC